MLLSYFIQYILVDDFLNIINYYFIFKWVWCMISWYSIITISNYKFHPVRVEPSANPYSYITPCPVRVGIMDMGLVYN
jgi:hypothetical protein